MVPAGRVFFLIFCLENTHAIVGWHSWITFFAIDVGGADTAQNFKTPLR